MGTADGYAIPNPFQTIEQGYIDTASRVDDYNETGAPTDSFGNAMGSINGQISTDLADCTDKRTLNIPSYGISNGTYTALDPTCFDFTQPTIAIGDGVVLLLDQTYHTVSATVQVNGAPFVLSESPDANGNIDLRFALPDGTFQAYQFKGSDFLPPDAPTVQGSAARTPAETCTAGGYCQWSMTAQQGAAVMGAAAVTLAFISKIPGIPPQYSLLAQFTAGVSGLAAADLAQQAAQQKKKKNKKNTPN